MKTLNFIVYIILSLSTIPPLCRSLPSFRGISPQDEIYYSSLSATFKCIDGSKKLSISQLNDDFCDCPDASDEPGTPACPNGKFYCRNAGHAPLSLFSSRVNDGICDCCDGSDEYDSQVKCPNTCWEAGKVARDKLTKKIATYQEGVTLRKQEIEQAKLAFAKDKAELSKLKDDEKILKGLVQQLKEQKEQIEKMEEKERLEKEKEEKLKKEAEEEANPKKKAEENADSGEEKTVETNHHDKIGSLDDSLVDKDLEEDYYDAVVEHSDNSETEKSSNNGVKQHAVEAEEKPTVETESGTDDSSEEAPEQATHLEDDTSDHMESLSREELGRLVASRWTGENAGKETTENDAAKDVHEKTTVDPYGEEDDDGYGTETDDSHKYDDDVDDHIHDDATEDDHHISTPSDNDDESYFSDTEASNNPTWLEKIQQTVRNILNAVNLFKTPVDKSEAAHIRKEYDESSSKLSKIQSRISSLTEKLKLDFGQELEFYSFYNHCFESKENKYVYKVCPYKQASQVEGHSTTRLGRWDKFEESYRVMVFSNGDKCWNGPDRSLKVKLRCGLQNEVTDVDEPSRCEYVALLATPALCVEEKLKELQQKLELMNKQQPQTHDEL